MAQRPSKELWTCKQLAELEGLTQSTIHYYTSLGLLQVKQRSGNKRLYDPSQTKARLQQIALLRQKGYSLSLIRQQIMGEG